jgi:hypothetical protein
MSEDADRKIYLGDSWRQADDRPRPDVQTCRSVLQSNADRDLAEGRLTEERWRVLFDLYSEMKSDGSF